MWEWSDKLKLGKSSSAFVKKNLRPLPLTEVEFEADFFLDRDSSSKRQERWMGMAIQREFGGLLAMEEVRVPPPAVNSLANLLAHAMLRPSDEGDRQRPSTVYLRDRPQWLELLPHLRQLGIGVVLSGDLPRFDKAVLEWMQETKKRRRPTPVDKIKTALQKPFPERRRSWFTDAMDLMEWTDTMFKGGYPSRKVAVPSFAPMTVVSIQLTADELEAILTKDCTLDKLDEHIQTSMGWANSHLHQFTIDGVIHGDPSCFTRGGRMRGHLWTRCGHGSARLLPKTEADSSSSTSTILVTAGSTRCCSRGASVPKRESGIRCALKANGLPARGRGGRQRLPGVPGDVK